VTASEPRISGTPLNGVVEEKRDMTVQANPQ